PWVEASRPAPAAPARSAAGLSRAGRRRGLPVWLELSSSTCLWLGKAAPEHLNNGLFCVRFNEKINESGSPCLFMGLRHCFRKNVSECSLAALESALAE